MAEIKNSLDAKASEQLTRLFEADPGASLWLRGERRFENACVAASPPAPRTHVYRNVTKLPWWVRLTETRPPNVRIGPGYMDRWHLIPRNRFFNIYLHHFLQSDDDRALHDHPWWNFSYLLSGEYTEHTISAGGINHRKLYKAGDWKFRTAKYAHRIELTNGGCWTLFITGPRIRVWGFHCPKGWVNWQKFTDPTDTGKIGAGCGEYGLD